MPPIDIVRALCASNLMAFVQAAFGVLQPDANFHAARYLRALCYQLERLERGDIRRLLIILPYASKNSMVIRQGNLNPRRP